MAYIFNELKEAPAVRKVPPLTLPLEFCYLAQNCYEFLKTHGLKDFAKVTAILCTKNLFAKGSDDYFITTVTHTDTEDGKETSIAFYEYRLPYLDPQKNYGFGFEQLRDIAERHGLPIAVYFETVDNMERGELDGMTVAGINWKP